MDIFCFTIIEMKDFISLPFISKVSKIYGVMSAYAVAYLDEINVNREIITYLNRVDETLEPFDGHFLVHGKKGDVVEGSSPGLCIIIEFPDLVHARNWYLSGAYQEILPLRTNNSEGSVILIDGVPPGYRASDLLRK